MENKQPALKKMVSLREFPAIMALVLLCVILIAGSPNFLRMDNLMNTLRQASIIAIVALGQALILISGEVDLSVGVLMGFCGIMGALLWEAGLPPALILLGVLLTGALVTTINALLITKLHLAAFAVTLGMQSILKGAMLVITGGFQLKFESPLAIMGHGYLGPIPYGVVIMVALFVLMQALLQNTPFGRWVYITGSNKVAARISGVAVDRVKIMSFTITGALCGIAGLMMAGSVLSAGASSGIGYETDIIAGCVIGGTTLRGGEGSIVGVVIGSILLAVLKNGFVLLNLGQNWQLIATGAIIVISIIIDSVKNRKFAR